MIPLRLADLADVVAGTLAEGSDGDAVVDAVTIDSRDATPGALFVPLAGEHADGHDFVPDAVARGASGYLWAEDRPVPSEPGAVVVDDPADALMGLGRWVRDEVDPLVVTITGSQGKTTTKDMIAAAVGTSRVTVANQGSYNNELGVPLTCCRLQPDSEVLVAEVGARGIGHIAVLAEMLRPDVAVVTAVSAAHLELLGDIDTVARAKTELVEALGPTGTAVLNADDQRVAAMAPRAPGAVVRYAVDGDAEWRAEDVTLDAQACARFTARGPSAAVAVELPMPGAHNVGNALAAIAVADVCGVAPSDAAAGLASAQLSPWRMELHRRDDGVVVINDAYNANPSSTAAALDTLAALTATRRWAVLGLMAELGPGSAQAHREIGQRCARLGIDWLVPVGSDAEEIAAGARAAAFDGTIIPVDDAAGARDVLTASMASGDAVLVKASRSVGLERLALELTGSQPA